MFESLDWMSSIGACRAVWVPGQDLATPRIWCAIAESYFVTTLYAIRTSYAIEGACHVSSRPVLLIGVRMLRNNPGNARACRRLWWVVEAVYATFIISSGKIISRSLAFQSYLTSILSISVYVKLRLCKLFVTMHCMVSILLPKAFSFSKHHLNKCSLNKCHFISEHTLYTQMLSLKLSKHCMYKIALHPEFQPSSFDCLQYKNKLATTVHCKASKWG